MTPLEVASEGAPVPPPPLPSSSHRAFSPRPADGLDSNKLFLDDIRNGITLKPTKTQDKSTPAFIKKSNGVNVEQLQTDTDDRSEDVAFDGMKDALQEELRNTLKRKIKKHAVESGDPSKNHEIEKAMEFNRTVVELKVNTNGELPSAVTRDNVTVKSATVQQVAPAKPPRAVNGKSEPVEPPKDTSIQTAINLPPVKQQISSTTVTRAAQNKPEPKVIIRPFESSATSWNGTLRKVSPRTELKIDVSDAATDSVKRSILSPEVKNGNAAIRPSQIRTLTKQGSHVSHIDIVEDCKPITKSPISLVEVPKPTIPQPAVVKKDEPIRSGQSSPRTPTRSHTILDTKTNGKGIIKSPPILTSSKIVPTDPPKRLLISHPKASFTLNRTKSRHIEPQAGPKEYSDTKPVFRILTQLEQSEQQQEKEVQASRPGPDASRNYVSFAKELTNASNNYPDTVLKTTTVGTVKEDVYIGNTNLRDIKIDIVENGQLKVTNK